MKKVFLLLAVFCATGISAFSQQGKIGHINGSELVKHMKEFKIAQAELEQTSAILSAELNRLANQLDSLQKDHSAHSATWSPTIREIKEKTIIQLNQNLQDFQESAQNQLAKDEQDKMDPIYFKAYQAIEKVAKANGFIYILDSSAGALLYRGGEDVTALVCAELGIEDFSPELKKREDDEKARLSGVKPTPPPGPGPGAGGGMVPKNP